MYMHQARRRSVTHAFAFKNLVLIVLVLLGAPIPSRGAQPSELRPFTVQDSIGLSYFANPVLWTVNHEPPTEPIVSPDRKHFLVVTQRGILATNQIESSIWVFDWEKVEDFLVNQSGQKPRPRRIADWHATSNTPVVSDVRWLSDSRRVAFLAKADDGITQVYSIDTFTNTVRQLTHAGQPVSAYDISGDTVAYTTFDQVRGTPPGSGHDLADVTGQTIWSLLWRSRSIRERDEPWLLSVPNTLHIIKNGRQLTIPFRFEGRPLRLYFPTLFLSPDGNLLITVAPVVNIPSEWKHYQARFGYEDLVLVSGDKSSAGPENNWKASQFVILDIRTGIAHPLIDAPAGRAFFQDFAPTKAIWSPDSESVLLSDTFLPLTNVDAATDAARRASPAAVTLSLRTHKLDTIAYFPQPAERSSPVQHVADVDWNTKRNTVELFYASSPDNVSIAFHEAYRWGDSGWKKTKPANDRSRMVSIRQDLNHAPVLSGTVNGEDVATIWDPNPQLASIALGKAALYEWHDKGGAVRRGILVLPPDFKPGHRYPLVVQTHGFEPNKFFTDGIYTTGSGGRALCGRGMIVLQTDQYSKTGDYQRDAEIEVEAFTAAIEQLSLEGLVDPHRVGIIGFSFTVYHVLYAITHYPDLFAAASITDGNDLSYWLYLLWTDIPAAQQMGELANGGVKPFGREQLAKWQQSAPGFNLDRVKAPLLISCLERGTLVATWDIYGGLRTLRKPVELVWLRSEDAPHVLVQPNHRYGSQELAVDWFDFWLNGHIDSNRKKASQYIKWQELRTLKHEENAPAGIR